MRPSPRSEPLFKASISTTPEAEDAICELLSHVFGQPASVYADTEKQTTTVIAYSKEVTATNRRQIREGLQAIRAAGLKSGLGRLSIRKVPRENWAESWKRHFKPLEISRRLLVLPSWIKRQPKPGQAIVVLDPGLSFGTGHHPTTAFCLEQIAKMGNGQGCSLLDIGCGSGILSIAALKLGYQPVVAFDFDPEAVRVARQNAAVNGVTLDITQQDLTKLPARTGKKYDLVCANLIYDLLIQEQRRILARMAPHGTLVLAGILQEQFPKVRRAYEKAGLRLVESRAVKEWRSGSFQRR